jgi:hypothetical protein
LSRKVQAPQKLTLDFFNAAGQYLRHMASRPHTATDALVALRDAQAAFDVASGARHVAILDAVRAGANLREIAQVAQCSHESVRRIAATNGGATLVLGDEDFALTEHQVEMLIHKLDGSARGAFPKDIELLAAGTEWLPAAGQLANRLQHARSEESSAIVLDNGLAFALYQILRLTYTGRPTVLSRLYDVLFEQYGKGEPHVIAALGRNRPRKR